LRRRRLTEEKPRERTLQENDAMKPAHAVGLVAAGLVLAGGVALALRRRDHDHHGGDPRVGGGEGHVAPPPPPAVSAAPPPHAEAARPTDDPIVAPAYPFLDLWPPEARRALVDLQRELGLDPRTGGLAGVIAHESGGDPAAPHDKRGTPRGGLIQVTVKANLPGYTTADAVWGIRNQDRVTQLRGVVRDFYRRQMPHGPPADQSAVALLRRNYLPGLASRAAAFVLAVRPGTTGPGGEKPEDHVAPDLTYGANYTSNPGFDPAGRGWFTWEDVDRQSGKAERAARALGWTRVSGARVPPGDTPVAGVPAEKPVAAPVPPNDEDVYWHPWRYPPGTKVSEETMARLGRESEALAERDAALRAGWAEVISRRDAAPADCPCRGETAPLIAAWESYVATHPQVLAAGGPDGLAEQWSNLAEAQRIQSGLPGEPHGPGEAALDVRERAEFDDNPRPWAENVPVSAIDREGIDAVLRWAAGRPIVVYCKAGVRAERVVRLLRAADHAARNGHDAPGAGHTCRAPRAASPACGLWEQG
jgi:rhodanese-related sulfurtransferase